MIPINPNLEGKVAVVTGGSGVLCGRMAKELARHKVKVVILNRTKEKGLLIEEEIKATGGEALAISCDVLDRHSVLKAEDIAQPKLLWKTSPSGLLMTSSPDLSPGLPSLWMADF